MKVTLVQTNSCDNKDANLRQAEVLLREALETTRPQLIALPKLFTYLGGNVEDARASAETIPDGPAYPWGTVRVRAQDKLGFITADLDFDFQAKIRADLPSNKNRVLEA